jgi:phosphatidylethanolamine-binding protein (PEBP) family uncharacterized protein
MVQNFAQMKDKKKRVFFYELISLLTVICIISSCNKEDNDTINESFTFYLTSPVIGTDSLLPEEYTCDGDSSTLPLDWSGYPKDTKYFALIMYHIASPSDIHWYWILYNIPSSIDSLPKNVTGIGTLGTNSVNGLTQYAPPCSQGPGRKDYIITVYALSKQVLLDVAPENVNRNVFLEAIDSSIISSAGMTVWYTRNVQNE